MTNLITNLKPIVLDSSTWMNFIEKDALKTGVNLLYTQGYIPLFTLHNFEELLKTNNDSLRKKRIVEISSLEHLYSFSNVNTASNINLVIYEYQYILGLGKRELNYKLLNEYITSMLEIKSGESLLGDLDYHTKTLHEFANRNQPGIYFASLPPKLHNENIDIAKLKLSDLDPANILNSEIFNRQKQSIKNNFESRGDKKKKHQIDSVDETLDEWRKKAVGLSRDDIVNFYAELNEIPSEELSLDMSLESFLNVIEESGKIKVLASMMNRNYIDLRRIKMDSVPTLLLDKLFYEAYQKRILSDKHKRAETSSMTDRYLAYFSIYFDTLVDKRTNEILKSVQKDLPFDLHFKLEKDLDL